MVSENILKSLIEKAKEVKQSVWVQSGNKNHPLIAVYHQGLYSEILSRLNKGELKLQHLLNTNRISFVESDLKNELQNFNTKEDLQAFEAIGLNQA